MKSLPSTGASTLRPRLRLSVSLERAEGAGVSAASLELLRRLDSARSLREAAVGMGLSYRHAWNLLHEAEMQLGQPLARSERGRGTALTPFGALVVAALAEIDDRLERPLAEASQALAAALALGQGASRRTR
ncbi:MAG: winged helix-turn-helix domain-containing protein [Pseudomonadota bacterium]|jgi:molybdate transport repressor ModE-like protein